MPAFAGRRIRLRPRLAVSTPRIQREWYSTKEAALLLGISQRTIRRRIAREEWVQGRHYRWILRETRQTLEIHVPRVVALLEQLGWG